MKVGILTTVSAIVIMAAILPAQAQTGIYKYTTTTVYGENQVRTDNNPDTPRVDRLNEGDLTRGWERTQGAVSNTLERTEDFAIDTYYNMRDTLAGDPFIAGSLQISQRNTAKGMIGQNTYTPNGEVVATVEDIIIDRNGNAEKIVLRDGGFLGLGGSLVAADYDQIVRPSRSGDTLEPVQKTTLNQAPAFTYNSIRPQGNRNEVGIPADGLSVSEILDGSLVDARNQKVAEVENLTFKNGNVDYLIVSYNDTFGVGGEVAAIKFDELQPARMNGQVDFRLSASQSQDFLDYRNSNRNR